MRAAVLFGVVGAIVVASVVLFSETRGGKDAVKSALPTEISAAKLKIGASPSNTLEPNLGVPSANPFGFTIPDNVSTTDEAVDYVRQVGSTRYAGEIYKTPDVEVTTGVGGIAEMVIPKMIVIIKAASADEAQQAKVEWGGELRKLFGRWDLCDIDISWELSVWNGDGSSTELISPHHNDPNLDESFISPGCDKPAVKERYPYGF
jgi:hypothetical protein